MKLDLNDNEIGAFVAAMDIALKGGGLAALAPVSVAMAVLEAAKRAELEAAAMAPVEQPHDIAE